MITFTKTSDTQWSVKRSRKFTGEHLGYLSKRATKWYFDIHGTCSLSELDLAEIQSMIQRLKS